VTAILGVISWILCWTASVHIRCFYNSCDISGLGLSASASASLFPGLVNVPGLMLSQVKSRLL